MDHQSRSTERGSQCRREIRNRKGETEIIDVRTLAPLQFESLKTALYTGSPSPKKPGLFEKTWAKVRVALAPAHERKALKSVYCNNSELWAFALRDTDKDGIPDFRFNYASATQPYFGKFKEGDVDIDGDGIRNILDSDPFDPGVGGTDTDGDGAPDLAGSYEDRNANTIPDHLDWALLGKSTLTARIQEKLYRKFGVILVERTLEFTDQMAAIVNDAIEQVYSSVFKDRTSMPTLRMVATDQQTLLTDELDDGTIAEARPYTQSVHLYKILYEEKPLHQLGVVVHELAHSIEYAMDFDPQEQAQFIDNLWIQDDFMRLSSEFGWRFEPAEADSKLKFKLFSAEYAFRSPFSWNYDGLDSAGWVAALNQHFGKDFFSQPTLDEYQDPLLIEHSIIGKYSLGEPGEWHAEQAIAHLFNRLEDWLRRSCPPAAAEELIHAFTEVTLRDWTFYHPNALGGPTDRYFAKNYPISDSSLGAIAARYWPGAAEACGILRSERASAPYPPAR